VGYALDSSILQHWQEQKGSLFFKWSRLVVGPTQLPGV
jgi:hypothetical protein